MTEKEELVYCEICEYGNMYCYDEFDADAWCDKENDAFDVNAPIKCKDYLPKRNFKGRYGYDVTDNFVDKKGDHIFDNENPCNMNDEWMDLLNEQDDEIEALKKQNKELKEYIREVTRLKDDEFTFTVTENKMELFKDKLYIKDAHTTVEMIKGRMLKITVYPPRHAPMIFCYHITGKTNML